MKLGIECVLRYKSFPQAAELWRLLAATHPALAGEQVDLGGDLIRFEDIEAEFRRQELETFSIEFASGEIMFGQIANCRLARLEFVKIVSSTADAQTWLTPLIHDPSFVQARVYDADYDYWQNAHDLLQYQAAGRSAAGLPMVSNGLQYPMAAEIVDTSRNPGRSVLRTGYIESVGATMWLGSAFWQALNRPPPDWTSIPALQVERHDELVRIQASSQPFTTSGGEEGEMQAALRRLIFGV